MGTNANIRVMLVDDHTLVRQGIKALLTQLPRLEVIAETGSAREAIALLEQAPLPDLVLLDIAMGEMNGIELAALIAKRFPQIKIMMLSMYGNAAYVEQALRAGARGYLLKDASLAELDLALRCVMRGETYLTPAVNKQVLHDYVYRLTSDSAPEEQLTPRQREVLRLIAEGRTTREIAQILTISVKTVETHRTLLMERLDIHDVAGLVRYALRIGLIAM